jgi:hypothetical protein
MSKFDDLCKDVIGKNASNVCAFEDLSGRAWNTVSKFIEPIEKQLGGALGKGIAESDFNVDMDVEDRGELIEDLYNGTPGMRKAWEKWGKNDSKEPGKEGGQGIREKLLYPLFRDPIFKRRLVNSLQDYRTTKSFGTPETSKKGKRVNYKKTFQEVMRKGGMDINKVYDVYPPQKKEDIVWLSDVSGSMQDTFVFISPFVDALRELGLKQRFFMGDTGDSFVEVPEGVPFGAMLEKIGNGGTDIGAGVVNVRRAIKSFKDKSFIIFTDTVTGSNFKDEVDKVTREGGKVLILNPTPNNTFDFSDNKRVKDYTNVPTGGHIGGFIDVLKDARGFIMKRY